jgi:hypothetical protein
MKGNRTLGLSIGFVLSLFLLPALVAAACSIGANPLHMSAQAVPGETVVVSWNLYNIHGDRTTHVVVEGAESNPSWEVLFDPEVHTASYNVTGVIQEIDENVGLAPTEVVDEVPDPKPEGYDYVNYPGGDGYIPVRPIGISVKVPEDVELFEDYVLEFQATGNCFMETGTVIPGIATKLELTIRTVSGEPFFETPVDTLGDTPDQTPDETPTPDLISAPTEGGEEAAATAAGEGADEGGAGEGDGITGFLVQNSTWIGMIIILLVVILWLAFRGGKSTSGDTSAGGLGKPYEWKPSG